MDPSLRADVGEMLCVGFHGTSPSPDVLSLLQQQQVGGVILFRRNIESGAQVAALNNALQEARSAQAPLLIAVDQEGGPVARLRGITTDLPPMAHVGATGDEGLAHAVGACLAEELTALGFNFDFAPVVDVHTRPENPVIGIRAFGADPERVGRMAAAQIHGMTAGGLLSCAKHFPGHGDTVTDSHYELPVVPHALERLEQVELAPFRAAIRAGVPSIMTAHVVFPALDPRPATLSGPVLTGLLRGRLGFEGVIVSDDLEMKALSEDPGVVEAAIQGLHAGVDLFLVCHRIDRQLAVWEALVREGERGGGAREKIAAAAGRVRAMKARLDAWQPVDPGEALAALRSPTSLGLVAEIGRRAVDVQAALTPAAPALVQT